MKLSLFVAYLSSILFSVIMAFIYKKDLRRKGLFILLPYLLFVFIQEISVFLFRLQFPKTDTNIVYNFYRLITVLVFSFLFYQVTFRPAIKKVILTLVAFYLTLFMISFVFFQTIYMKNAYQATAGGLMLTTYSIFFFIFYFNLDSAKKEKKWEHMIPIAIGLAIFYPVSNITQAFQTPLLNYDITIIGMRLYNLIPQVMSIFMYCCFARAFYLCRKKN